MQRGLSGRYKRLVESQLILHERMVDMEKIKCAYCGQERPQEEMRQGEIIFRDRRRSRGKAFMNRKTNWYCADKNCNEYDQMAHEG
jgi:hypothetical protein